MFKVSLSLNQAMWLKLKEDVGYIFKTCWTEKLLHFSWNTTARSLWMF